MPSITIRVPFVIIKQRDELVEAVPLTHCQIRTVAESSTAALRIAVKRLQIVLKNESPMTIVGYHVGAAVRKRTIQFELPPPKAWRDRPNITRRDTITIPVASFAWDCSSRLVYHVAPQFQCQVIACDDDEADRLLAKQIRQSQSLAHVADGDRLRELLVRHGGEATVVWESIDVDAAGPDDPAAVNEDATRESSAAALEPASRWLPSVLRPAYGRDSLVTLLLDWITGDEPRSVVLVGRSGVGKTAIVHEAIRRVGTGTPNAPKFFATDGPRLIAGQCGFGMLQERCLFLAGEIQRLGAILHLGNLTQLIESGKISGTGGCASLLTPRITSGRLIAIIEATPEEYALAQRTEPRLLAGLETVHVDEPDAETTRRILMESAIAWQANVAAKHKRKTKRTKSGESRSEAIETKPRAINIEPEALIALDQLHRRFPTDAASPGRPLAFLSGMIGELPAGETLTVAKVNESFGRQTGLPTFLTDPAARPDLDEIRRRLSADVVGQRHAIDIVVDTLATLATWLTRGDRPLASLLLIGPTGVGKTETAKAIARLIYRDPSRMIRIDLSEFSGGDAVRRLIGDPYGGEGVLTGAIRAQPFSLLLLDEFEKADHGVFDLLLQVLGEGRLTDARGRLADFRNCIVMMTSNLGVESYRDTPLGLVQSAGEQADRLEQHFDKQVRTFLRPELYNRIDRIIAYRALDTAAMKVIARSRLHQVQQRDGMLSQAIELVLDDAALDRLVTKGYEPQYGARPLARTIERDVVTPLAEAMCLDRGRRDVEAKVHLRDDELHVAMDRKQESSDDVAIELTRQTMSLGFPTYTRRCFQFLQQTSILVSLRSREIMNRRLVDRQLQFAKNEAVRSQVFATALAVQLRADQADLKRIEELGAEIAGHEREVLSAYYKNQLQINSEFHRRAEGLRSRLYDAAIGLLGDQRPIDRTITLICLTSALPDFVATIEAYKIVADQHAWPLRYFVAVENLPGQAPVAGSFVPPMPMSFQLNPWLLKRPMGLDELSERLHAQPGREDSRLNFHPLSYLDSALIERMGSIEALLIEVSGHRAAVTMLGELGEHRVLPESASNKDSIKTMYVLGLEGAAHQIVSLGEDLSLVSNAFELRRFQDQTKQSIRDLSYGRTLQYRNHPERRIADLINNAAETRIMHLLRT